MGVVHFFPRRRAGCDRGQRRVGRAEAAFVESGWLATTLTLTPPIACQRGVETAEAAHLAAQMEHDAAVANRASPRRVSVLAAALDAATAALALARRPLKFVTNWCFAPKGTEVLAHLVRSWTERHPRRGVIADDLSQMYQDVSRKSGFSFLRKRFPSMLGVFRFFYAISSVIWFGGAPVPVHVAADGSAKPAKVGDPGAVWLRSHDGGRQGCGGSTIFCVGGYHETLLELQRLHPDADIACTADDTPLPTRPRRCSSAQATLRPSH